MKTLLLLSGAFKITIYMYRSVLRNISLCFFLFIFSSLFSQTGERKPIGFTKDDIDLNDYDSSKINGEYELNTGFKSPDSAGNTLSMDLEKLKLPPLNVFLESVYDHPSTQVYETMREEQRAQSKMTKEEWLNYLRLTGQYQYGQWSSLSSNSASDIPLYYVGNGKRQHMYNVGVMVSIPLGDLFGNKQKNKVESARLRQIEYQYDISVEERKFRVLEAYNEVLLQLAVLKAKADAAALYNAQMKISEQDFINGKISIIELSLERSRRTDAIVKYQEGKASLQNAITLLEMLTNVRILTRE